MSEYKRLIDADLAELADLAEEIEAIADVSDLENKGPMYAGQHMRSGIVRVSKKDAENLRRKADIIRRFNEEFAELAKAKEYGNREYCRAMGCTMLGYIEKKIMLDIAKDNCRHCKAYQFHDWLNKNGYKIIKAEAALQIGGA